MLCSLRLALAVLVDELEMLPSGCEMLDSSISSLLFGVPEVEEARLAGPSKLNLEEANLLVLRFEFREDKSSRSACCKLLIFDLLCSRDTRSRPLWWSWSSGLKVVMLC